ncbi:MAG: MBL fold metallo-hydrolase [Candidatus Halalkalibacterium sp. M3_1C_030]
MEIYSFTVGPFAENTYLLTEENIGLLIDPGFFEDYEFEAFKNKLSETEVDLQAIVLTHAHVDHVLGLQKTKNRFDVPVYLNDSDRYLWDNFASQAQMFGFNTRQFTFEPTPLKEQKGWRVGPFEFDVLYTPGHSPDHVSLYNKQEGVVIAGDALFKQGIGRTDLYKGSFERLEQSIRECLYSLPDDTEVYPGHGPQTTIGYEKKNNPFVKAT